MSQSGFFTTSVTTSDPELAKAIELELGRQRHEIELIDAALERIKVGDYGYSVVSGLPIPRLRLDAIPWTQELVMELVNPLARR
mgnify:CR=1 FL=1